MSRQCGKRCETGDRQDQRNRDGAQRVVERGSDRPLERAPQRRKADPARQPPFALTVRKQMSGKSRRDSQRHDKGRGNRHRDGQRKIGE